MALLSKGLKKLMTVGLTAGIYMVNAQAEDEMPHSAEPERQLETPAEIRKNTIAEEAARNQDPPDSGWLVLGKVSTQATLSGGDSGIIAKGGAFVARPPDENCLIGIRAGMRVGESYHQLSRVVRGNDADYHLSYYGFRSNTFYTTLVVPFSQNPKGPYAAVGRFDTYIGYENGDDYPGWLLPCSADKAGMYPSHHTGGYIHYPINDKVSLRGYLITGWDETFEDTNQQLSYGTTLSINPTNQLVINFSHYGGKDGSTRKNKEGRYGKINFVYPGDSQVDLSSAYIQYNPNKQWTYALAGHYGTSKKPNLTKWYGVGGYAAYKYNEQWVFAGRAELIVDENGFVSKLPIKVRGNSIAVSAQTKPSKKSDLRMELRYSWANLPSLPPKNSKSQWDLNLIQTYTL